MVGHPPHWRKGIPQGLKPLFFFVAERPEAKASGYLEAFVTHSHDGKELNGCGGMLSVGSFDDASRL